MITSDLHLGHKNICKFRTQFSSAEEHDEIVFDNLASNIKKRDSLFILGDAAFNIYWLKKIGDIKCVKKTLILGNHDSEYNKIIDLAMIFDAIHSLYSKRNCLFSHVPIHPQCFRSKNLNIHGHMHDDKVLGRSAIYGDTRTDMRYFNACVEHTDYKPISFAEIIERTAK